MFYGRSNFGNFWTKIWPSKQLKATNDTPDRQFSTYSRARRSVLLQTSFSFWEIARFPVNCTHFTIFASVKLQQRTIFKKWLRQALHCPSYSTLITRSLRIHRYWTLFLVQKKSRSTALIASVQSRPCTCAVERYERTVSRNLTARVISLSPSCVLLL